VAQVRKIITDPMDMDGWSVRRVNAAFRMIDESHLFPIKSLFNVTDRAIRRLRRIGYTAMHPGGIEYALTLDSTISEIVNSAL